VREILRQGFGKKRIKSPGSVLRGFFRVLRYEITSLRFPSRVSGQSLALFLREPLDAIVLRAAFERLFLSEKRANRSDRTRPSLQYEAI
jgi:hypothetical protein